MSAFNKAQFNLAQFNVQTEGAHWFNISFVERVDCIITTSSTSFLQFIGSESVSGDEIETSIGRMISGFGSETINFDAVSGSAFFRIFGIEETVFEPCTASQKSWIGTSSSETVDIEGYISQNLYSGNNFSENIDIGKDEEFAISQLFYEKSSGNEVVDATTMAVAFSEYICDLSGISLAPGESLVIDAGTYNVLVNKQNAIHEHSGEWLDDLNRMTRNIKISADNTQNLTATILYTERYL